MQPSNEVQRGTNVSLKCQADFSQSQSPGSLHNYEYIFFKDYLPLNTDQINATDGLYFIPDARVSHSGKYKCAVGFKKTKKESSVKDLKVKGKVTHQFNV